MECYNKKCGGYLMPSKGSTGLNCKIHSIESVKDCDDFTKEPEISCYNCKHVKKDDGIECKLNHTKCGPYTLWEPIPEYPKKAAINEAVAWMEKGNWTISPSGHKCKLFDGFIKNDTGQMIISTLKGFKEEWTLLPPEKKEVEIDKTTYLIDEIAKLIMNTYGK